MARQDERPTIGATLKDYTIMRRILVQSKSVGFSILIGQKNEI